MHYPNKFWFKLLIVFCLSAIILTTSLKVHSAFKYSNPTTSQQSVQPPLTTQDRKNYLLQVDRQKIGPSRDALVNRKKCKFLNVPIKFLNRSSTALRYLSMSCGWDEVFVINNKTVRILPWACDKNVQTIRTLLPGKSETYNLPVFITASYAKISNVKIGINLIIINKQNQASIYDFDFRSSRKENVIWSNEVTIN